MEHITFPSINQYRQVVKSIRSSAEYYNIAIPTVTFEVSKKIHGTNLGVCRPVNGTVDDIWVQSRENIITPLKDNAGAAMFIYGMRNVINGVFDKIAEMTGATDKIIQIYAEFFGGNIQKGVGVNGLPKTMCIIGIRVSENAESSDWQQKEFYDKLFDSETLATLNPLNVYTKYQFGVDYITIDFNSPEDVQNLFVQMVESVESDCPVARYFKPDATRGELIGEGVVCVPVQTDDIGFDVRQHFFKCKGEKHSASKVRTIGTVDVEKVASIDDFVERCLTENRLQQGLTKLDEMCLPRDMSSMGAAIKWAVSDVLKEELDTLSASGLIPKDVTGKLSVKARNFYMEHLS